MPGTLHSRVVTEVGDWMLDSGQIVDRYTVESVIGYGGTAVVYLVRHVQLSTAHALKVLSVSSGAIRERMLREGRVQAAMTHANLVGVSDVIDVDGSPGLLMEYIEGPSLEEALKSYRISLEDAETLFHGIVLGVQAAHQHGLVHRDLKPANVLLSASDEGYVPKVTDFGLAKVLVGEGQEVGTTRAGIAMGTPSYMAPEQVRDARQVDQRADVFSLGCLLYELVTGQRAFPGEQALTIYNAVTAGEYLPAEQMVPDLPPRIVRCVDGCLAVDRDERIPDCQTLLEVLAGHKDWTTSSHPVPIEAIVERLKDDVPLMPVAGPFLGDDFTTTEMADSTLGFTDEEEFIAESAVRSRMGLAPWMAISGVLILALLIICGAIFGPTFLGSNSLQNSSAGELAVAAKRATQADSPAPQNEKKSDKSSGSASQGSGSALPNSDPENTTGVTPPVISVENAQPSASEVPKSPAVETTESPRERAPVAKPAPKPARPKAVAQVQVKLLSVPPNAALQVDEKDSGRTNKKIDLKTGTHRIRLKSGDQNGEFKIKVREGSANKWCYDFESDQVFAGSCPVK